MASALSSRFALSFVFSKKKMFLANCCTLNFKCPSDVHVLKVWFSEMESLEELLRGGA